MVKKPKRSNLFDGHEENQATIESIHETTDPAVTCTKLPEFIRAKKHLGSAFCVYLAENYAPEGTRVVLQAGNYKNPNAELKNNISYVWNRTARFNDLRFLGKSGRGTRFNVYIRFECEPVKEAAYLNAIKVTVDGPRPPRNNKNKISQSLAVDKKESNISHNWSVVQTKPLKKRYREFINDLKLVPQKFFLATDSVHNTPPESPYQSNQLSLDAGSGFNSMHLTPVSSDSSTPSASPNSYWSDFDGKKQADSYWTDRESICHYLEVYLGLYKIRSCRRFSNFLADLVLKNLNVTRNSVHLNGAERFLINYNLFYQQLARHEMFSKDVYQKY